MTKSRYGHARRGVWLIVAVSAVATGFFLLGSTKPAWSNPAGNGADAGSDAASAEAARIQAYIDSIYAPSDVVDSFLTNFMDLIDCVTFTTTPSGRALAAAGASAPPLPSVPLPAPGITSTSSSPDPLDNFRINTGKPDANGHPRWCPAGTAPYRRLTVSQIEHAGGLNAYLSAISHKRLLPNPVLPGVDSTGYMHSDLFVATPGGTPGKSGYSVTNQGGAEWAAVFDPSIGNGWLNGGAQHSLSQIWIVDQSYTQTVEVGWTVDDSLFGDLDTHLFIDATLDNYKTTGCYDNIPNNPNPCVAYYPNTAGGANGPPFALGQTLCSGTCSSGMELEFAAINYDNADGIAPNWYVYALSHSTSGTPPLGAYLSTSGTNHYTGSMQTSAGWVLYGGEVEDESNPGTFANIEMGSGACGATGYGQAAYLYNAGYWDPSFNYRGNTSDNFNEMVLVPSGLYECPVRYDLAFEPPYAPSGQNWNTTYPYIFFGGTAGNVNPSTGLSTGSCSDCP